MEAALTVADSQKVEFAGYAISFLFWHELASQVDGDRLRDLLRWLQQSDRPDLQAVLTAIEERTGVTVSTKVDIKDAITKIDQLVAAAMHTAPVGETSQGAPAREENN